MDERCEVAPFEELEAGRACVAGRSRVEHEAAAHGRPVAEDDAVAARRHRGRGEAELRPALSDADDPGIVLGRPVVDVQAHPVRDRLELVERDVQAVGSGVGTRCDERVASAKFSALDSRKRHRDALPGFRSFHRPVVHLNAANANVEPGRLGAQHVSLADRSRPERSGRHRPDSSQGEDAVDEEPRRALGALLGHAVRRLPESATELVEPFPGLRARDDHLDAGHELPSLLGDELHELGLDRVGLRDRDHAVLDPEQPDDRQMLKGLRPRSLARIDDEEEEVDAARARHHVAHEALVARHVDEREPAPVREVERCVAEVDGDPARLLLGEPVGVFSGQRPDEPRLAVVDVPCSSYRERHSSTARAASSTSSSVSVRQSSKRAPSRTIPITGGSARRSGSASVSSSAQAKLLKSVVGSEPPPARATVSSTVPPVSSARRSARARTASAGSVSMWRTGGPARPER